jgi:nucleoside-diphosphate-sugar epimerase
MRCLVTGATGFIGRALIPHLRMLGHEVIAWPRSSIFDLATSTTAVPTEWIAQLQRVDTVVHLAGLAHQRRDTNADASYFLINRNGTLRLAAAAGTAGVKRFIFLSSAKVFGEGGDMVYRESSPPAPHDAYAKSKLQAEQLLVEQFSQTMELVILRPPLVYSRDAKANFGMLMDLAKLPIPLPFAGIENQRSLLGLENLLDLISMCLTNPNAAGKTWLCADAELYSLADIFASIRKSLNRDPNLFHLPNVALNLVKMTLGSATSARLFGDFKMDCSKSSAELGWTPPFSMQQILRGRAQDSSC